MLVRKLIAVMAATSVAVFLWVSPTSAHEPGTTAVLLDIGDEVVTGTIQLPLDELGTALQLSLTSSLDDVVSTYREPITTYIADHLAVAGEDGGLWRVSFGKLDLVFDNIARLDVPVTFSPSSGTVSNFTLQYDGILELDETHRIFVSAGVASGSRRVVGVLEPGKTALQVDPERFGVDFWTMIHHGFDHVGKGADHLLFLLVLLLPAPLVVAVGRWQPGASGWRTLRQIVHVVTAFTVGHSVTLVASALGWVDVPSRPVEILIAVSVGAGAVHAMRPLIGHREAIIAGAFGLVHGLAFAGILDDLGLSGSTALGSLFGFNLGIELAQLSAVVLVFPSLYAMSRTPRYAAVRVAGAAFALVAACAWVADRASWVANPLQGVEDAAVDNPFVIAGALAVLATATVVYGWLRPEEPYDRLIGS